MSSSVPSALMFDDEGCWTETSLEQQRVEAKIISRFNGAKADDQLRQFNLVFFHQSFSLTHTYTFSTNNYRLKLFRNKHIQFCKKALNGLSSDYEALFASQPWLAYWNVHALDILGALDDIIEEDSNNNNNNTSFRKQISKRYCCSFL
jgi:hypothetical protein